MQKVTKVEHRDLQEKRPLLLIRSSFRECNPEGSQGVDKVTLDYDDNTWEAIATMIDLGWD